MTEVAMSVISISAAVGLACIMLAMVTAIVELAMALYQFVQTMRKVVRSKDAANQKQEKTKS